MLTKDDLETAVARGIITTGQRNALVDLAGRQRPAPMPEDSGGMDENLRLVGGGNDLFVTIGTVLLGVGLYFTLSVFAGDRPLLLAALLSLATWLTAEFVTRQKRMRLSSTVLALAFSALVAVMIAIATNNRLGLTDIATPAQALQLQPVAGRAALAVAGAFLAAIALYFWRFRVPVLAGLAAVTLTALGFFFAALFLYDGVTSGQVAMPLLADLPNILRNALYVPLVCGLLIFAGGVALDFHDRERVTIWSDCAFWLHIVSAPLLVHPLFIMATGQDVAFGRIEPGAGATAMLAVLIVVFVYVSLAIDRRSLLIPTLAYFGTLGIYYLVNSAANSTGIPPFALILLAVGALILMFGAGWQRIRRLIVGSTLPTWLINKLPTMKV